MQYSGIPVAVFWFTYILYIPKTYERLAQKTVGTKTILSRGVTGKTL